MAKSPISIIVAAIALAMSACADDRIEPSRQTGMTDQVTLQPIPQSAAEPNYIDPNTGQTFRCANAIYEAGKCEFVLAKPNFVDMRTGQHYFCIAGAITRERCLAVHE
jgi:hypothetical protein